MDVVSTGGHTKIEGAGALDRWTASWEIDTLITLRA
jgi:hypothetical protein